MAKFGLGLALAMLVSAALLSRGGGGSTGGDRSAESREALAVFGDSISIGAFADGPSYADLLCNWFNCAAENSAISGAQAGDMAYAAIGYIPAMNRPAIAWVGANDARLGYSTAHFERMVLDLLVKAAAFERHAARENIETGSWSDTSVSSIGRNTVANGATSTATVDGDAVYIGFLMQESGSAGGTANVIIDGDLVGSIDTDGTGVTTNPRGLTWPSGAVRFDGLGPGSHTVEIEVTSSGKIFYLEYIAGSEQPVYPPVFAGNVMRQTAPGADDATSLAYSQVVEALVSDLSGDGLNVSLVDVRAEIDPLTDYVDYIHPNAAGHVKLFEAFKVALAP